MLTAAQRRFIEAEKSREIVLKEYNEALQAVAGENKIGEYFQDDEDGTVYKIVAPAGRWVKFESVSYVRTRRSDEKSGTLSAKEAREQGFEVK